MRYIPNSPEDRTRMLQELGLESIESLFASIPEALRLGRELRLPPPMSEPELTDYFTRTAARNQTYSNAFLGGGVYRHYIPSIVEALAFRSEFYTAYTPYQAEIAQGTLQAIFEFQTYVAQLTGMDIANASLYDGSTALAEAVLMAHRSTGRDRFLLARSLHPEYREVVETYACRLGLRLETAPYGPDGRIDLLELESRIDQEVGGVVIQTPNFFGVIENYSAAAIAHDHGALAIVNVAEAMSLGLLKPPGLAFLAEERADIVCGEAQSFGVPMNFGGPHVGFIAARERHVRQIPGRLVGMSRDAEGRRAFTLTLATREQHIRREKATSNICTNQSLCALMTTIYLAVVGPKGLREIAEQNVRKTAYVVEAIQRQTGHEIVFSAPRFNEFVLRPKGGAREFYDRMIAGGIIPGIPLGRFFRELDDAVLVCVTEVHSKASLDAFIEALVS